VNVCGDSTRVVHPLFQEEEGGSTPTSPLQLQVGRITVVAAIRLNFIWHSRLPDFRYPPEKCIAYGAEHDGIFFAAAIWSQPSARMLNHRGMYELRRLAIAPDAPKNTASRMLRVMRLLLRRLRPDLRTLISYQDTAVHTGGIYKAAGWAPASTSAASGLGWNTRSPNEMEAKAPKVRWEIAA
jgi:hypothetical protein